MSSFKLVSQFKPTGDQPGAIAKLTQGISTGEDHQVLLGVTGSGKTFTVANVIERINRPTLIISHNKTLAAQLYQEFRDFFPANAVEYFVSYYDYYQPESYIPQTDTYIEKDADINELIDQLRLKATASLLTRQDVIVVASVSCIYNLGSPAEYARTTLELKIGSKQNPNREVVIKKLVGLNYARSDLDLKRGTFRVRGEIIDIWPAYDQNLLRIAYRGDSLQELKLVHPIKGTTLKKLASFTLYPAKHYVAPVTTFKKALEDIRVDLKKRTDQLNRENKKLEAYRLEQRTNYDLEMLTQIGYCKGIENYSRYFDGRRPGEAPYCLLDYFKLCSPNFLTVIDESHITVPQIRGMYRGDRSRKETLIDYGFRLPSALDNRPLRFEEFQKRTPQVIYTSATPAPWEIDQAQNRVVEQLIRPTGLLDPQITILPTKNQIPDLITKIKERVKRQERTLVTTLTKRMAEDLAEYLKENTTAKVNYLHSDINTLERTDILDSLRRGDYDVLVGINLLREGLDLPEVSLVAILDADKEGFLRSETSLIQVMGRAARHLRGEVAMYADHTTGSMRRAINEVNRRRQIQENYNQKHHITPQSIQKPIRDKVIERPDEDISSQQEPNLKIKDYEFKTMSQRKQKEAIKNLEKLMKSYAETLEFEQAAVVRDKIRVLKK